MAEQFELELVSPEALLLSEPVDMVVVPGEEGDFGVLAAHAPMISTIRPGTIRVYSGNTISRRIFVAGGFAEVTGDRCTILAELAQPIEDMDRAAIDQEIAVLREKASAGDLSEAEHAAARADIALQEAKLAALAEASA